MSNREPLLCLFGYQQKNEMSSPFEKTRTWWSMVHSSKDVEPAGLRTFYTVRNGFISSEGSSIWRAWTANGIVGTVDLKLPRMDYIDCYPEEDTVLVGCAFLDDEEGLIMKIAVLTVSLDGKEPERALTVRWAPSFRRRTTDPRVEGQFVLLARRKIIAFERGDVFWVYNDREGPWVELRLPSGFQFPVILKSDHKGIRIAKVWSSPWIVFLNEGFNLKLNPESSTHPVQCVNCARLLFSDVDAFWLRQSVPGGFVLPNNAENSITKYRIEDDGRIVHSWTWKLSSVFQADPSFLLCFGQLRCVSTCGGPKLFADARSIQGVLQFDPSTGVLERVIKVPRAYFVFDTNGISLDDVGRPLAVGQLRSSIWRIHEPTLFETCAISLHINSPLGRKHTTVVPADLPRECYDAMARFKWRTHVYDPRANGKHFWHASKCPLVGTLSLPGRKIDVMLTDESPSTEVSFELPSDCDSFRDTCEFQIFAKTKRPCLRFQFWCEFQGIRSSIRCYFRASWNKTKHSQDTGSIKEIWNGRKPSASGGLVFSERLRDPKICNQVILEAIPHLVDWKQKNDPLVDLEPRPRFGFVITLSDLRSTPVSSSKRSLGK